MQRKWFSVEPKSNSSTKTSRDEMITKLRIFNNKFGTRIPPDGAAPEMVQKYYQDALDFIEDDSSKNCSMLHMSLKEFAEDIDEEDPGRKNSGCYARFWEYVWCTSQTED
jgi:hypothetical protein